MPSGHGALLAEALEWAGTRVRARIGRFTLLRFLAALTMRAMKGISYERCR